MCVSVCLSVLVRVHAHLTTHQEGNKESDRIYSSSGLKRGFSVVITTEERMGSLSWFSPMKEGCLMNQVSF